MVRQVNQPPPSSYPSPPGGNLGGLAKHIFDLATPDIEIWDNDIISPGGTYETETSGDECNRVTKIYFVRRGLFNMNNTIKSLISTFVWRNPNCGIKPPKKEIKIPDSTSPVEFPEIPDCLEPIGVAILTHYESNMNHRGELYTNAQSLTTKLIEVLSIKYPLYIELEGKTELAVGLIVKHDRYTVRNNEHVYYFGGSHNYEETQTVEYIMFLGERAGLGWIKGTTDNEWQFTRVARTFGEGFFWLYGNSDWLDIAIGYRQHVLQSWKANSVYIGSYEPGGDYIYNSRKTTINDGAWATRNGQILRDRLEWEKIYYWDAFFTCGDAPPPPPEECCKDMSCCPKNDNLEQLLRLILKRIGTPQTISIFDEDMDREGTQKAKKTPQTLFENHKLTTERVEIANRLIGIENYPVEVPETMIEPYKEGLFAEVFDFIQGEKKRKIKTLTELLAWQVEQDSATTGRFHQVFEFEIEEGKKETVVVPNIAEALKETIILNSQMARQMNILVETAFRTLTEMVQTKTQVCKSVAIAQDIQDYLDYPTVNKSQEIKVAVNFPTYINEEGSSTPKDKNDEENYQEYLKEGKARFQYEDWTGENSFHDQLMDLLQVASMLRAILYQRVDKDK